jgi:hypothetical protein
MYVSNVCICNFLIFSQRLREIHREDLTFFSPCVKHRSMKVCGQVEVQLHEFLISELGTGVNDQFHRPSALFPGKEPFVHIEQKVRWGPELVQILWRNKSSAPRRIEPRFSGHLFRGLITSLSYKYPMGYKFKVLVFIDPAR